METEGHILLLMYCFWTMQKGHHETILFANSLLEGIRVVGGMMGKTQAPNQNQGKPKQKILVLEMHLKETVWQ